MENSFSDSPLKNLNIGIYFSFLFPFPDRHQELEGVFPVTLQGATVRDYVVTNFPTHFDVPDFLPSWGVQEPLS